MKSINLLMGAICLAFILSCGGDSGTGPGDDDALLQQLCAADSISLRHLYVGSASITGDITANYPMISVSVEAVLPAIFNPFSGQCLSVFNLVLGDTTVKEDSGFAVRVLGGHHLSRTAVRRSVHHLRRANDQSAAKHQSIWRGIWRHHLCQLGAGAFFHRRRGHADGIILSAHRRQHHHDAGRQQ